MPTPVPWITRNRAQLRLGVRITVAGLLAFSICHLLGLPQSYPAVLTAVIVTQASVGASLKAMLDRFVGSLGGAVWGVGVLLAIRPSDPFTFGAVLLLALVPLAFLAALKPSFRAAPVTAIILLLSPANAAGPLAQALQRVLGIGLGSVVALAVALLVLPARAHGSLAEAAGRAVTRMGDLAAILVNGFSNPGNDAAIQSLHDEIRRALAQAETAADEAMRERTTYLASGPDPQPLCRALRRIRNDLSMIGRVTVEPLPEPLQRRLTDSTASSADAITAFLHAGGEAIANRKPSTSLEEVDRSIALFSTAIAELRRTGVTRELPDELVGRVFGFAFSLEQLHRNLEELADRINELAEHP